MHPDPQEIIPDYCQSHIFYHLLFIVNGSAQCGVRLTSHIIGIGQNFLSCFRYKETEVNVHSGFEAKYNMKMSARHLTSWDSVSLTCCCQCSATVYRSVSILHIYSTVCIIFLKQRLVTAPPPYIKALEIIPLDDMFLFSRPFPTAAALLSWHFQGISYYSDVFIETYCLILYY